MNQTKQAIPFKQNLIVSQAKPLLKFLKKQRENKKFNQTIEIAATFLLISVFLFSAIKPALITISGLVGEIRAKQLLSNKMRSKINDIIWAQDAFSAVQEKYFLIESSLPSNPRFSHAVMQLKNITNNSNINLDRINFNLKNKSKQSKSDLDMIFSYGVVINDNTVTFTKIPAFVQNFSQNRRIIKINRIELSHTKSKKSKAQSPERGKDQTNLSVTINTDIYYWLKNNENNKKE